MSANKQITFPCLKVKQPLGDFYVGVIPAKDVLAISYADVRRIEARDIEKILGIQRELQPARVRELQQYVRNIDATFPTSVILALRGKSATYNSKKGEMSITRHPKVASIIDGQHRIAGLEEFDGDFDLNVTIFVDMDIEDQAMTFATINLAQTKVCRGSRCLRIASHEATAGVPVFPTPGLGTRERLVGAR
jgi:DGQHR domain-containing protein